jgi:hypothetical protein
MTNRSRVLTAALLIAVPVLFMLFYGLLTMTFDYPGILREPAGEILRRFAAGGPSLVLLWYGFALTPALFIPAAILLRRAFPTTSTVLDLAVPLGVLAGMVQVVGLIRWPFLVPEPARTFLDPAASEATQAAETIPAQPSHDRNTDEVSIAPAITMVHAPVNRYPRCSPMATPAY